MHLKAFFYPITRTSVWRYAVSFSYLFRRIRIKGYIHGRQDNPRQKIRCTGHLSKIDKQLGEWLEKKAQTYP